MGQQTLDTVIGEDGTFDVLFAGATFPDGGTHEAVVVVLEEAGDTSTLDAPSFVIDTTAPDIAITAGTVSIATATMETDGVINAAEHADGVTVTGTAQGVSSMWVTFGTATRTVATDQSGAWSADFAAGEIAPVELRPDITAIATDPLGNTATASGTVQIDTAVTPFAFTSAKAAPMAS